MDAPDRPDHDDVEEALEAREEWLAEARQLVAVLFTQSQAELPAITASHPDALAVALEEAVQIQAWHERQAELARTVVARLRAALGEGILL